MRAAVFTTFSFDPGFFELHILPLLFEQPFSQVDKVRRIQLEDALRDVAELAVYYDRSALAQDGEPAQLDYRRIDLQRPTGVFHPKLALVLVDEHLDEAEEGEPYQSLVVGVLSANLTRGGWWENVECAHFEEIQDKELAPERCAFRPDLLSLLRKIRADASADDDQRALDLVYEHLVGRTSAGRLQNVSSRGIHYTRIFCGRGRDDLPKWLSDLRLEGGDWNLEVVSPFFDPTGPGPLPELIEVLDPRETRVFLPLDLDGSAEVSEATYRAVDECGARWSELPTDLVSRKNRDEQSGRQPPRRVHAKVYRLWRKGERDLLIVGSPNLTHAAFGHSRAGNLEAAFLVDATHLGNASRWWLQPLDDPATRFAEEIVDEREGLGKAPLELSFRFDWAKRELAYRLGTPRAGAFSVEDASGRSLFEVSHPRSGSWFPCNEDAARLVEALLSSSSFLVVRHFRGTWRLLVREENMAHRPSLLTQLSAEEILEYWSLLTPAQRAAFLEPRVEGASLDGLSVSGSDRLHARDTMFDRFAGIYHAFGCLERTVEEALDEGREREAEARLLGAKYDSLPSLLDKVRDAENPDPVTQYVTFLCALQLRQRMQKTHRRFFSRRKAESAHLEALLGSIDELRAEVALDDDGGAFLEWYEQAFLRHFGGPARP